jgi:hypothetical protein
MGYTAFNHAKPIHAEISRMRGASFYLDAASVRNHYQLRLVNKRNQPVSFEVSLENAPRGYTTSGVKESIHLAPLADHARALVILAPRNDYSGPVSLTLLIKAQPGNAIVRQEVDFLGPNPRTLKN